MVFCFSLGSKSDGYGYILYSLCMRLQNVSKYLLFGSTYFNFKVVTINLFIFKRANKQIKDAL